jgi:hypothetical protein
MSKIVVVKGSLNVIAIVAVKAMKSGTSKQLMTKTPQKVFTS